MHNSSNKILIMGPSWIGDMVIAQTLFKLIKKYQPNATIDVLAPKWCCGVLERMPQVDNIIVLPFEHGELALCKRFRFAKNLRHKYDQAIVLPNSFKSALIPYWAKIPKRTGWRGEMRYGLLNDLRILVKDKLPLMVQHFAALALDKNEPLPKDLPVPRLSGAALSRCSVVEAKVGKILSLCPGAEYGPAKRWPVEYFAEVAKAQLQKGWQVWLLGGPKDQILSQEIQKLVDHKCIDFAGKTSLTAAIDLLAASDMIITNDTGLMHVAAAVDKPLIAIFGSSSPHFTPPLNAKAKIVSLELECKPCFKRICRFGHYKCLRDISAQMILQHLDQ